MEQTLTVEGSVVPNGDNPMHSPAAPHDGLEQRVRRLEDTMATLQDTRLLEERVVERVAERVGRDRERSARESAGIIVEASRRLLPAAISVARAQAEPPPASPGHGPAPQPPWLIFEAYTEAKAMLDMYLDPRFRHRLSWYSRVGAPLLLLAIVTSWIWLPGTSILPSLLSTIVVKAVDLVLAFLLFKILSRDARRYREAVPSTAK